MSQPSFPSVTDPGVKRDLERWGQQVETRFPWGRVQFVTVSFTVIGQDVDITHALMPADPEGIRWVPVSQNAPGSVYQDLSATRKPWQPSLIFLRANAVCTVRLLLFTEPSVT